MLYETVGLAGEGDSGTKTDLQALLAERLVSTRDYKGAAAAAQEVLESGSKEHHASALKSLALAECAMAPVRGAVSEADRTDYFRVLLPKLTEAVDANPQDTSLALVTAQVLREYPLAASPEGPSPSAKADAIMDRLVASTAEQDSAAEALLARSEYRKLYMLQGASQDMRAALDKAPDNYIAVIKAGDEAILRATELAQDADDQASDQAYAEAEKHFRRAIEINPSAEQGWRLLAKLFWIKGDSDAAIDVLDQATQESLDDPLPMRLMLADLLLAAERVERAKEVVDSLDELLLQSMARRMPGQSRDRINSFVNLLRARILAAQGDELGALDLYGRVARSPAERAEDNSLSAFARQASFDIARLHAGMGNWDQTAAELAELSDRLDLEIETEEAEPTDEPDLSLTDWKGEAELAEEHRKARLGAVDAFLRCGQPAMALDHFERLHPRPFTAEEIELRLRVELDRQAEVAPDQRRWEEFEFWLERGKNIGEPRLSLLLTELHYQVVRGADGELDKEKIEELLIEGTERWADKAEFWRAAANAYFQVSRLGEATDAMRRYRRLETDAVRSAKTTVGFLVNTGREQDALGWLTKQLAKAPESDLPQIRILQVRALVQANKTDEALAKAHELIEAHPDSDEALTLAMEVAINFKQWELAERCEKLLVEAGLLAPSDIDFYRAVRLVQNYSELTPAERTELGRLVADLKEARPTWRRTSALAASYAEALGDDKTAIGYLEKAVARGDRSPETLERLSHHLFRTGQYERADEVIQQLFMGEQDTTFGAEALYISMAVRQKRMDEALKIAREAVERHPEDVARRLWLYKVLLLGGETEEAQQFLSRTRQEFPDNPAIWDAQFTFFAANKRVDEARRMLGDLPSVLEANPFTRHLTLARGYEKIGDLDPARDSYQAALLERPADTGVRYQYASLLLSTDPDAARTQLEKLVELDPGHSEARRKLAGVLASKGESTDWQRIDELLGKRGHGAEALDQRLRAVLLTRRGRTTAERAANCELARRILTDVVENAQTTPKDIDRLLLAGAYEQEGLYKRDPLHLESARQKLQVLLDNPENADNSYQDIYITFLIRSISALDKMEDSERIRAGFIEKAYDEIRTRRSLFQDATGRDAEHQRYTLLSYEARLLVADQQQVRALELLAEYGESIESHADDEQLQAGLMLGLANLYTQIGANQLAEEWYRELTSIVPKARVLLSQSMLRQGKVTDAINLFLENEGGQTDSGPTTPDNAILLAGLLASNQAEGDAFDRAWPMITEVMDQNEENVQLILSVAVLQVTRGNQDEAIRLFRKAIAIAPDNVLALNNLATLLGERERDRAEALSMIEQAIKVEGRKPALLDTQGTIQLQMGDADSAIASLEESVATLQADPRYYFHLAAAYLKGGRETEAAASLQEARKRGIDNAVLTAADQELMLELKRRLDNPKTAFKNAS
ncbi:tetratricopeptide repeat protein [Pseudobythopirellula maris]|uniref:tetratricopeptide repeat protein n=1 Tax=Pseudobythopirellula maris TaxID=2527991 RepID=UPI0018D2FB41|nr:tetratricopeptide repeat protein [Pseudobythopirellula maris]